MEENFIRSPLDRPVLSTEEPILQPTPYVPIPQLPPPPQPTEAPDWSFLDTPIAPPRGSARLQKLQETIQRLYPFEIKEKASVLNGFTIEYKIDGRDEYEPRTFL